MALDRRYNTIKKLISQENVFFREIFETLPKSVVARDLGINNVRFSKLINNVDRYVIRDLVRFAGLLKVSEAVLVALVMRQLEMDKKSKKRI